MGVKCCGDKFRELRKKIEDNAVFDSFNAVNDSYSSLGIGQKALILNVMKTNITIISFLWWNKHQM